MSDTQKYQKKKNLLIVLFLILLIAFVCVMCAIVIYAKKNPPRDFLSPDEIEIRQIQAVENPTPTAPKYTTVTESTTFKVKENEEELELILTDNKEIKLLKNNQEETIQIMQNDKNVNNNIKIIYQSENDSLILTETGEIYKLIDTKITQGQLKVGQIMANTKVNEIIRISPKTESTYVLAEENKMVNIDNQKEYSGIIAELKSSTSTIYVYENGGFGTEEGKVFVDESNTIIKLKIAFDNKVIGESDTIYEVNAADNTLSTSKLGMFEEVGYKKETEDTYKITLQSNTGVNNFTSSYYYYTK